MDAKTVQAIVSLGGVINYNDISCVMKYVEDPTVIQFTVKDITPRLKNTDVIRLYRQSKNLKFSEELLFRSDHDALFKQAMKDNCIDIVETLVLKGTEVIDLNSLLTKMFKRGVSHWPDLVSFLKSKPESCIQLFYKAVEHLELTLAIECLLQNNSEAVRSVDLSVVIKLLTKQVNLEKDLVSFIEKLLKMQVNPNREVPLNAVLKLSDEFYDERIELLRLLLQ